MIDLKNVSFILDLPVILTEINILYLCSDDGTHATKPEVSYRARSVPLHHSTSERLSLPPQP